MSSLSKMRTASTGSSVASNGLVPMEIGWVNKKGNGKGKGKDKGKEKGKSKEKGKGKKQSEKQGEKFEGWKRETGAPSTKWSCYGQLKQFAGVSVDKQYRRSQCKKTVRWAGFPWLPIQ